MKGHPEWKMLEVLMRASRRRELGLNSLFAESLPGSAAMTDSLEPLSASRLWLSA